MNEDELAQLVDERSDDAHRWLAFRAIQEITALRRQVVAPPEQCSPEDQPT